MEFDTHSNIPIRYFYYSQLSNIEFPKLFWTLADLHNNKKCTRNKLRKICDEVQKYVCGHLKYSEIKLLFEQNKLSLTDVIKYLSLKLKNDRLSFPKGFTIP